MFNIYIYIWQTICQTYDKHKLFWNSQALPQDTQNSLPTFVIRILKETKHSWESDNLRLWAWELQMDAFLIRILKETDQPESLRVWAWERFHNALFAQPLLKTNNTTNCICKLFNQQPKLHRFGEIYNSSHFLRCLCNILDILFTRTVTYTHLQNLDALIELRILNLQNGLVAFDL